MFVVVEFNQASGQPRGRHMEVYDSAEEAQRFADLETADNRRDGRRETYQVYELVEIEED